VGEPVSWLRLERHHLHEIAAAERARIDDHLASCEVCRMCLARIESDARLPLPSLPRLDLAPRQHGSAGKGSRWRRFLATTDGPWIAAAAFVVVMAIGLWQHWFASDERTARLERPAVKGGEVTFSLVRDDGEMVAGERGIYRERDRLKALVTCPPETHAAFDLVVLEADGASFPLEPAPSFSCGNAVPLPGAFRLTGGAEKKICIGWNESGAVDRGALAHARPSDRVVCLRLIPGDH
jgi:hypothetical protein